MFFKKKEDNKKGDKKNKKEKSEKKALVKKSIKKKRKNNIVIKLKQFITLISDEQHLSEMTVGNAAKGFINFIKVFIASYKKFSEDDCFTKATAITYTALMSLIPTLTVAFTFVSIFSGMGAQREELFMKITRFLAENNLQRLNIDPFLEAISGLLDNAASIGGIGAAVMIFSATALLRTLEQSLNVIWKVKKQRPIFLKIIYYWSALTLGPLMLIAGTTIATQLSTTLTSPHINHVEIEGGQMWIVGSKATVALRKNTEEPLQKITSEQIDFDNQRVFSFSEKENMFVEDETTVLDELDFGKNSFNDMQIIDKKFWVVGEKGILLRSEDGAKHWYIDKLGFRNLNDIHMFDDQRGLIACDRGILLSTEDGGFTWNRIDIGNIDENLNQILFDGNNGFIIGDRGYLLQSADLGTTWNISQLEEAKVKKYHVPLNSISIEGSTIVITGNDGIILTSHNKGKTFKVKKFKLEDYTSSFIISENEYYIGTSKGRLIKSTDDGITWEVIKNSGQYINQIYAKGSSIWISGNAGMFLFTSNGGLSWGGKGGKSMVYYLINFFAPFAVIWLLFLLIYIGMPNIKVPFGAAAIGASFTGSVWVAFIFIFIVYVKSFANGTFAVYGALAAFPIFLLLIYASAVIILFGAEVAYTLMYPATYKNLRKKMKLRDYITVINGIRILHHVYRKFESGKGDCAESEILKICSNNLSETDYFLELFTSNNLLLIKDDKYIPATSSSQIKISTLVNMINHFSFEFSGTSQDPVRKKIGDKFSEMEAAVNTILGEESLADIINPESNA